MVLIAHSHWSEHSQTHPPHLLLLISSLSSLYLSLIQTRIIIIIMHTPYDTLVFAHPARAHRAHTNAYGESDQ